MSTQINASAPENEVSPTESTKSVAARPWAFRDLPPFPGVALKLLNLLDQDDVPMKTVSDLIRADPAISAEILRVSNSAMYGVSREIDNVAHALVVLGTDTVKRLALTVSLGRFCGEFLRDRSLRACWDHSIACALICQELAIILDEPKDRAYTAGLLHDIGRLAILSCYPTEYGTLLSVSSENEFDELEAERELFEIDHCAAGTILAREWNLPDDFVEAISTHHSPQVSDALIPALVAAGTAVADRLGYNIMRIENFERSILDVIQELPLEDFETSAERLENLKPAIEIALKSISPARR